MGIGLRGGASPRKTCTRSRPLFFISDRTCDGNVMPRLAANASAISSTLNCKHARW